MLRPVSERGFSIRKMQSRAMRNTHDGESGKRLNT
jgi:hypothetical protein